MRKASLIIFVLLSYHVFAEEKTFSVYQFVEQQRIDYQGDVVIDTWTGYAWENTKDTPQKLTFHDAQEYCQKLKIGKFKNFRLPEDYEVKDVGNIKNINFKNNSKRKFWTRSDYRNFTDGKDYYKIQSFVGNRYAWTAVSSKRYLRCVDGKKQSSSNYLTVRLSGKRQHMKKFHERVFRKAEEEDSVSAYLDVIRGYFPKSPYIAKAKKGINEIFERKYEEVKSSNTIEAYSDFITESASSGEYLHVDDAVKRIYELVKKDGGVEAYDFYLNKYSNFSEENKKDAVNSIYKIITQDGSLSSYIDFINEYDIYVKYTDAKESIYEIVKSKDDIRSYQWFMRNYASRKLHNNAISGIYKIVKNTNSISSYRWFIKTYPNAKQSREALKNLHKRAFALADDIGTIASYNDFVIAYPFAAQVEQANQAAYALEEDEYSSFFTSDAKLSRALLVRSKQMERKARDGSRAQRPGYMLVVNRMNELLQEQFPAEEATLRYLESEEFKSFYRDFKRVLNRIDRKLADIRSNTSNLSSLISEQTRLMDNHFAKAAESREMSAELTKQHRFWERYLAKNE